ncbi:MFS transporter [Methanocella paludicola SANAE]|uniref:MFS transporter n=1 Tax=Methanocella paludicola (strain DSM 17711 / JCM 13418 / NBRC 101707 / SANAE) TaxID=304371 RepID=D1Z290_METPS|nr:MFS transporter [Methanocella paludicola]BAI62812.1 MFS transporter [Methanocella paludicola SANAE]
MALSVDVLTSKIERNIQLNYVYTMLMNTMLEKGIWMLFLSYRGLDLVQIGLVESVYQLAYLLFGLPAGAIGDLIGRKASLYLSIVTKILSYVLILISGDFLGYSASFVFGAISWVLYNSASESITYESCRIVGKGESYKQIYGNILALAFIAAALGVFVGGFLAENSYENVYYAGILIMLAALVPAYLFTETRGVVVNGRKRSVLRLFGESLRVISGSPLVLYVLVLFAVISTVDMTVYMYCQKYFQTMGIPVFAIGVILAVDSLFAALGGKYSYALARLPAKTFIVIIPGIIFGAYLLLAYLNSPLGVPMLWLGTIFVVAFWPIVSDLVNARVPSENRATITAFKSQLSSAGVLVLFPAVGFFAERASLSTAFLWLLAFMVPLVAYLVIKIRKSAV